MDNKDRKDFRKYPIRAQLFCESTEAISDNKVNYAFVNQLEDIPQIGDYCTSECFNSWSNDWAEAGFAPYMVYKYDPRYSRAAITKWWKLGEALGIIGKIAVEPSSISTGTIGTIEIDKELSPTKLYILGCHLRYLHESPDVPEVTLKLVNECQVSPWLAYTIALQTTKKQYHSLYIKNKYGDVINMKMVGDKDFAAQKVYLSYARGLRRFVVNNNTLDPRRINKDTYKEYVGTHWAKMDEHLRASWSLEGTGKLLVNISEVYEPEVNEFIVASTPYAKVLHKRISGSVV